MGGSSEQNRNRERADEYMIKNICQYQPFIARGERAELFNSLSSSLTFSVLRPVQKQNVSSSRASGDQNRRPQHLQVAGVWSRAFLPAPSSIFITHLSHKIQTCTHTHTHLPSLPLGVYSHYSDLRRRTARNTASLIFGEAVRKLS